MSKEIFYRCCNCKQLKPGTDVTGLNDIQSKMDQETGYVEVKLKMVPPENSEVHFCNVCADLLERNLLGIVPPANTQNNG